ncbi:MAG: hypothetical protein JJ899_00105 [Alphaproteobacteria bacterium]|nr:hypothetical protein [Alphaproteobacteria bacterium]
MKGLMIALGAVAVVAVALFLVWFVDVDQTEEARLPSVDVQVEGGNVPEFTVETGDVQIREGEVDVPVPEVDVKVEEETVSLPTIDVDPPERDGPAGNQ